MPFYSINDINKTLQNINNNIEQRSIEKSEKLTEETLSGRGLWQILLVPTLFSIFVYNGLLIGKLSNKYLYLPFSIKIIAEITISIIICPVWYKSAFTLKHPLYSSLCITFAYALILSNI